jgi:glycosyltransferase involved in cell wall biosynthesis
VLHAHQIQAAGWLGAMSGFHPLVVSSWGSDILVDPHKSVLRRTLVRIVLRASDRLIIPSQPMALAADALRYPKDRMRFIPWGVETDVFRPMPADRTETRQRLGIDPDVKVIFSPRGLAPVYNQDVLLNAVHGLIVRFPDVLLLLLRFNVDRQVAARLEAMVATLGLDKHVRWLPPQTPAEMAQLDRMADVVVSIPSTEGYGFSAYEAMAAGCPTLVSDLPVFAGELVDGVHTLKVPVRDVSATRQRLGEILGDDALRQTLRQRAFEVVRTHSVSLRVDEAELLYKELCGRHED